MTVCTTESIEFTRCKRRKVVAGFGGGEITSDAGVLLLSQADKRLRLTERIAPKLNDSRCKGKCDHTASRTCFGKEYTPLHRDTKTSTIT